MNVSQQPAPSSAFNAAIDENTDEIKLSAYWDMLVDSKWLIAGVTAFSIILGITYALLAKPVYEADVLLQVEDSAGNSAAQSLLGEASSLFDVKTPATGEIEILRSRMVVGRAVEDTKYYINAQPRYLPIIGGWLARRATDLSTPGVFGITGYVSGNESIVVAQLEAPRSFDGLPFDLTAQGVGGYVLDHENFEKPLSGKVGETLSVALPSGKFSILVAELNAEPRAKFDIVKASRTRTVDDLQSQLQISEKGRQSGIIRGSMQGENRDRLVLILNEIGNQYVKQNIERKAAEAQKTLAFLDTQLPLFKKQLEQSEAIYNSFRNRKGTIALDEEAKLALQQTVELQTRLFEAQQQRRELQARFTGNHPNIQTLNNQISAWQTQIDQLNSRIKGMPELQQDALRFQRDVQVNNELYQSLLNNSLQLRLVKEGKVGNVRLLDEAVMPMQPVKPQRMLVVALATLLGLLTGIILAVIRTSFFGGIRSSHEIEQQTGLNVYSTIPLSDAQRSIARLVADKRDGMHLLASVHPSDAAIESLRSLRTSLQFAMLDSANNRVLITGATPSVGKSFVSANFAAIMALGGKRTLLIDADMRKGYLNQYFGLPRGNGLSNVIIGDMTLTDAVHANVLPSLDLLTTGTLPPNPAELLMSASFQNLLVTMSEMYDLVVIDTPPVLVAADTAAVAQHTGIVLLVARSEQTKIGELKECSKRLAQVGKTANGIIFNAVDPTRRYSGRYGYGAGSYRYAGYDYAPQALSKNQK